MIWAFPTPARCLRGAAERKRLFEVDCCVVAKAMAARARLREIESGSLFLNLDGRNLEHWRSLRTFLELRCDQLGLGPHDICIELSEAHQPLEPLAFEEAVHGLRAAGFQIAIDDFGTGVSGMQMLYQAAPDFIKIDKFFIKSMPSDAKKRLLVGSIVDLAHTLGSRVIAEGVETVEELSCCRDANCDLIQGYLIARPAVDPSELESGYADRIKAGAATVDPGDSLMIEKFIEDVPTLQEDTLLAVFFDQLTRHPGRNVYPVLGPDGLPRGAVRESDVKQLLHSPFGRDLARNRSIGMTINDFIRPIPTLESTSPIAQRLDLIADRAEDGVVVTKSLCYQGYLSSGALLKLANEVRLQQVAAQNPLTRLPGNSAIAGFLEQCLTHAAVPRLVAYIDIDHFKPFNDRYGFEMGDRAILILASILKSLERDHAAFVGHIGGDDFFLGAEGAACGPLGRILETIGGRFGHVAESLYSPEDRAAGFIEGCTRDGSLTRFPLLSCTVAALRLEPGYRPQTTLELTTRLTTLKSLAREHKASLQMETRGEASDPALAGTLG
ncbi:EAL domain-containing protein [Rhodobacter capsulatus]|uniref:EAL domain-containing protein n=1 Tax=Rhodobacter capsulatus TaxID=1061 RepID=UPI004029E478